MRSVSAFHTQASTLDPADVVDGVLGGLGHQVAAEPWLGALLVLLLVNAVVRRIPGLLHGRRARDPQRCFVRADKRILLERAGRRCEHHPWLGRRCRTTENLQADHVHPHSRGGSTTVANGQALCPRHNTRKANRVPWTWDLDRLARRREGYFPAGMSTTVVRHRRPEPAPVP